MPRALVLVLLATWLVFAQGVAYGVAIYDGKAYPVEVEVRVGPGNGTVEIKGLWYYDETFRISTISACWEAAIAAGLDPFAYNYTVVVEPLNGSRALVGTSLSLAVAAATYSALTNKPINASIMFTGTVAPGGVVDFVGGLVEKAIGARQYGFKLFVYPVLQHNDYKIIMKPKLYGVYGTLVETFQITPLALAQIIPIAEVGNLYQAAALATDAPYNLTANLVQFDTKAWRILNTSNPSAEKALLYEIYLYYNKSLYLLKTRPEYATTLLQRTSTALSYVQISKNYTATATEALPRALSEILVAYFYVRILTSPGEATREIYTYLDALQTVVTRLNKTAMLCDDAYAHMYIHLGEILKTQGDRSLASFLLLGYPELAAEAAYFYSQAAYALWKAALYLSTPSEWQYDVNQTLAAYKRYVEYAVNYADLYSKATDVISPQLVGNALLNYFRGASAERSSNLKAALGYYIEALTHALTYFAIHPAFPNTTAVKYVQYLDTLSHLLNDNSTVIKENLALASLAQLNETRVLYLARAHACLLAEKWANATPHYSELHSQDFKLPNKPKPPEGDYTPWILATAILAAAFFTIQTRRLIQNVHK
ncbi:MAG: hypothetical protein OWQ51_05890 [Pyrobaculum arsenaticum]|uniref:S16 family serine protease n=2 Tax=Pyrobaculum TaxID=2276 RepID=UPI00227351FB|nr:hypothetical protein [Pyrobaculum arsenaticum]